MPIRRGEEDDAVVLLDRLLAGGMVRPARRRHGATGRRAGRRRGPPSGPRQCAGATGGRLAAEFADSPQETRLRLVVVRAGLPTPVPQFRVFDDEGFVARVDRAFLDDRRRLNRLVAAGWVVLHVTTEDLRHPEGLLARLRALRAARLAEINAR